MNKIQAFLGKYGLTLLGFALLLAVLYFIYRSGKNAGSGNVVINENQLTDADKQQANAIVQRIHNDLNSGLFFGNNIWGNLGRDDQAYWALAAFSDTLFGYAYQKYKDQFGTSLVADIRDESSLPSDTYKRVILEKADKLNLV